MLHSDRVVVYISPIVRS